MTTSAAALAAVVARLFSSLASMRRWKPAGSERGLSTSSSAAAAAVAALIAVNVRDAPTDDGNDGDNDDEDAELRMK